jgi:hypothetical protein
MQAGRYEIKVSGRLGEGLAGSFENFDAEVEPAVTILRGTIRDQSDLHALLEQIQDLGLELVAVQRVEQAQDPPGPLAAGAA